MNWTLLLDGKDADGKLLLDFHGSESLIFFVQLYPTATKRPYSSSKIVSEKGFTMFYHVFSYRIPLFFLAITTPVSWTSWKPETKTLTTHTHFKHIDFPNTIVFQTKKKYLEPKNDLYSLKGPNWPQASSPNFKTKRREGSGPPFGIPGLQSAKDHLLLAPRLLHVDDWTMLLNPRCY